MKHRTNQEWLVDLRGPERGEALADLRVILRRGLSYALHSPTKVDEDTVEDL